MNEAKKGLHAGAENCSPKCTANVGVRVRVRDPFNRLHPAPFEGRSPRRSGWSAPPVVFCPAHCRQTPFPVLLTRLTSDKVTGIGNRLGGVLDVMIDKARNLGGARRSAQHLVCGSPWRCWIGSIRRPRPRVVPALVGSARPPRTASCISVGRSWRRSFFGSLRTRASNTARLPESSRSHGRTRIGWRFIAVVGRCPTSTLRSRRCSRMTSPASGRGTSSPWIATLCSRSWHPGPTGGALHPLPGACSRDAVR